MVSAAMSEGCRREGMGRGGRPNLSRIRETELRQCVAFLAGHQVSGRSFGLMIIDYSWLRGTCGGLTCDSPTIWFGRFSGDVHTYLSLLMPSMWIFLRDDIHRSLLEVLDIRMYYISIILHTRYTRGSIQGNDPTSRYFVPRSTPCITSSP